MSDRGDWPGDLGDEVSFWLLSGEELRDCVAELRSSVGDLRAAMADRGDPDLRGRDPLAPVVSHPVSEVLELLRQGVHVDLGLAGS